VVFGNVGLLTVNINYMSTTPTLGTRNCDTDVSCAECDIASGTCLTCLKGYFPSAGFCLPENLRSYIPSLNCSDRNNSGLNTNIDAVFLLDTSGSMFGYLDQEITFASWLIGNLSDIDSGNSNRYGIASFSDDGALVTQSMVNTSRALGALKASTLTAGGGTNMARAIDFVAQAFLSGLSSLPGRSRVLVIITDGVPNSVLDALAAADNVKVNLTTTVITIGVGGVNDDTMTKLASSPGLYFKQTTFGQLLDALQTIIADVCQAVGGRATPTCI